MLYLNDFSWDQLVDELRGLTEQAPASGGSKDDPRSVLHNLLVLQVELEMQNRELRDAQQGLEASRARYADLYDFAPIGCLTLSSDERILEINLTGAALIGRDRSELIGKPFLRVMPLGEHAAIFHTHLRRCRNERCRADVELEFLPKGRAPILLHVTSAPLLDADGKATACRTALTDVTDRRRAEYAEADARTREEFLGTVSHELRTPLNAIIGWVNLLQARDGREPGLERETMRHGLEVIARNAAVQTRLIEDILDVSRILAGKLSIDLKGIDLNPLVQASIDVLRPVTQARGIALSVSVAPGAFVFGDGVRLTQVLTNLLDNACKFTPSGGKIDVRVTTELAFVHIVVRDTGRGIAPLDLSHVFERFRQVDSSTTRTAGGLGLGLAIVDQIVRAHGGDVAASSPGLGSGATFTVRLRRANSADECKPEIALRESDGDSLEGRRVLCVDDDIDALEVMGLVLRERGAVVSTATSAAEAIVALAASAPDVLISDIGLPVEDGYSLIRQIRTLPGSAARVPAIALTAYAGEASAHRAREAGFQHYLSKPIAPDVLIRAVAFVARTFGEQQGDSSSSPAAVPPRE